MKAERVTRSLLGMGALCLLLVNAGCNKATSSENSGDSGGAPIASVQGSGDWGMRLLAGGTVGLGMFPAKFTFDVTAAPDCLNDYVVFNTSQPGVLPTTAATQTTPNTFAATLTPVGTITFTQQTASLALTASGSNTNTTFKVIANTGGGAASNALSLAARINALGSLVGVTATSSGATVTITASNNGIGGNSITITSTLSNFTLGSSPLSGGVGTGTVVAYNDLYSTQGITGGLCNKNGPTVYWSYATGTGALVTSVVLSGDGTRVAMVTNVGAQALLRILQWAPGEGTGEGYPAAPQLALANGTSWASGCPSVASGGSSCLSSIQFSDVAVDTNSAPFYNYNTDTIYVGDDSGRMHKFTGVFKGTPAEAGAPWPMVVNTGNILTSPVYDSVSGNIFVGDSTGRLSFIQEVGSTVGGGTPCSPFPCLNTVHLAVGTGGAIVDSPIVDGTNGTVFAVNGTETANNGTIMQASTGLTGAVSFSIGGNGVAAVPVIYSGAFDNTYFNSAKGATAGHMYVCGRDSAHPDRPYMYQLSFAAATGILTGVGASTWPRGNGFVSRSSEACSPVTEFYNPNGGGAGVARDWIFFSVGNLANNDAVAANNPIPAGACQTNNQGCVISVNITGNPTWPPTLPTTLVLATPVPPNDTGSTSGIIVDNQGTAIGTGAPYVQASSIYFSLGTNSTGAGPGVPSCNTTAGVGCAVKLTQSALN